MGNDECDICRMDLELLSGLERQSHLKSCTEAKPTPAPEKPATECHICGKRLAHLPKHTALNHLKRCERKITPVEQNGPPKKRQRRSSRKKPKAPTDNDLWRFLTSLGLGRYSETLTMEGVDLEALRLLSDGELSALRIPLVARKRISESLPLLAGKGFSSVDASASLGEEDAEEDLILTQAMNDSRLQLERGSDFGPKLWLATKIADENPLPTDHSRSPELDEVIHIEDSNGETESRVLNASQNLWHSTDDSQSRDSEKLDSTTGRSIASGSPRSPPDSVGILATEDGDYPNPKMVDGVSTSGQKPGGVAGDCQVEDSENPSSMTALVPEVNVSESLHCPVKIGSAHEEIDVSYTDPESSSRVHSGSQRLNSAADQSHCGGSENLVSRTGHLPQKRLSESRKVPLDAEAPQTTFREDDRTPAQEVVKRRTNVLETILEEQTDVGYSMLGGSQGSWRRKPLAERSNVTTREESSSESEHLPDPYEKRWSGYCDEELCGVLRNSDLYDDLLLRAHVEFSRIHKHFQDAGVKLPKTVLARFLVDQGLGWKHS
ncbi:hypothetical protein NDN08_000764 [Rhodosorus marinus]|uniref:SAM domain-containing protein n=1 Tax=Rhodosorus marinus TaxID=101924 RepID=A0AAV8UNX2_9RHOD|nr:hypothetical protein NDN08_000764 [Rhodosorus marinus]